MNNCISFGKDPIKSDTPLIVKYDPKNAVESCSDSLHRKNPNKKPTIVNVFQDSYRSTPIISPHRPVKTEVPSRFILENRNPIIRPASVVETIAVYKIQL